MTDALTTQNALGALNPATRALIDNIRRAGFPPVHTQPVAQARQSYRMAVGVSSVPPVALARVENFTIPGTGGHAIPARLWAPSTEPGLPVLLYLHGGGFVIGDLDTCDAMCRSVAAQSGVAVLAIDYRLAPEHAYPAGLDDAMDTLHWLVHEGAAFGLDGSRLAVAGDSAGATVAAAAALSARDAGVPLKLQALFYPTVQIGQATDSFNTYSTGLILDSALMAWFDAQFLLPGSVTDWRRQPLKASSHAGLAPAWIGIAECDPLADDGRLYAQALQAAGVPAAVTIYPGTVHDFINLGRFLPQAAEAHTALATAVRDALTG